MQLRPVPVGLAYQLGLLLVAIAMLLLPLLYLALIGVLAYGVCWYAIHGARVLFGSGGPLFFRVLLYLAPLFGGGVGVLFLVKPILARRPAPAPSIRLTREEQPLLYAFVERLCGALGAPAPREIRVDLQVNASASFRRGVRSMLTNDLVLTLGLPFVTGLSVTQFAGVLAHEFGHFRQAAAMRFTYLIGSVNHWFARVVYERDVFDHRLDAALQEATDVYEKAFLRLATFFVGLSRRLLSLLMYAGHVLSAHLSRQMEYHADRYQLQVVGSDGFRTSYLRTVVLSAAQEGATAQVDELMAERRLPDDLVALVQVHAEHLDADEDTRTQIVQGALDLPTGRFDTHPSGADRIRAAERHAVAPRMERREAARELFRDFDALALRATAELYEARFADAVASFTTMATAEAAAALEVSRRASRAILRVLYGRALGGLGLAPSPVAPHPPASVAAGIQAVQEARARAEAAKELAVAGLSRYQAAHQQEQRLADAVLLVGAEIRFPPELSDVPTRDLAQLLRLKNSAGKEREAVREELRPVFIAVQERVAAAVSLARHPELRGALRDLAPILANVAVIGETLEVLVQHWRHFADLPPSGRHLVMLLERAERYGNEEAFQQEAARLLQDTHDLLTVIRRRLSETPYPFSSTDEVASVADYLLPVEPSQDLVIIEQVGRVLSAAMTLYQRCWGDLALLVEGVEARVGLPELDLEVTVGE